MTRQTPARARKWLILGALALVGCVAEVPEGESSEQHITDGVATSKYSEVGAVYNDSFNGICTGTVIAPQWVLTAGHCVLKTEGGSTAASPSKLSYHEGKRPGSGKSSGTDVDAVFLHPNYGGANRSDLALMFLAEETDGGEMPLGRATPREGWPVLLVGYGKTTTNGSNQGTKRVARNTIESVSPEIMFFMDTGDGEGNLCNGDSGGTTLVFRPDGPEIIGVHSARAPGQCGLAGIDIRVDAFRGWIEDVTGLDL